MPCTNFFKSSRKIDEESSNICLSILTYLQTSSPLSHSLSNTHMTAFEGRKGLNWIAVLFPCKEHQGTLVFKKMDNCGFCHFVWYDGVCSVGRRQYPVHLPFEVKKMVRKRIHLYGVHSPMQETKWYKCNKLIFMVLGGRILLTHLLC